VNEQSDELPDGIANIAFIVQGGDYVRGEFFAHAEERLPWMEIIGMCLNALYQAATCHRKCRGGSHLLERLCGRAYNMTCAAYQLTSFGLYDEALTLGHRFLNLNHIRLPFQACRSRCERQVPD
jgi:hypothetical protein